MSDSGEGVERPKVKIEGSLDPDGSLARKLAKLQAIDSPGLTKAAEAFTAAQRSASTSKAAEIVASMQKSTAHLDHVIDVGSHVARLTETKQIEWDKIPEARRTRAAEETVEALKILVDEAIDGRALALQTDRRETVMLRWTVAGVLLAAIAAVASVIAILVG